MINEAMIRPNALLRNALAICAALGIAACADAQSTLSTEDNVQFNAAFSQVDLGWDSGYYPPGDPEPGDSLIQVRLMYGAAATVDAAVNGGFALEDGVFGPAAAQGEWTYDFGAEVLMQIAFNINFTIPNPLPWGDDFVIKPFVIDVPWVPNFDLRSTQSATFDSYLLDSISQLGQTTEPITVYDLDLVDLIAGAINLPDWVKSLLNAGVSLQVAIETSAQLACDNISLAGGAVFAEEGQRLPMPAAQGLYDSTAAYNETFSWDVTLHNSATVFISFLGLARWELPVTEIPWEVYQGPLDLVFSTDQVTFDLGNEGEGSVEGAPEGEIFCSAPPCEAICEGSSLDAGFEAALTLMYSGLDANPNLIDRDGNGIGDLAHARLVDSVLASPLLPIHCCVLAAWQANLPTAADYADALETAAPDTFAEARKTAFVKAMAGLATIGELPGIAGLIQLLPSSETLPQPDAEAWDRTARWYLAAYGYADTDAVCNLGEFLGANGTADLSFFAVAALDPSFAPDGGGCPCPAEGEGTQEGAFEGALEGEGLAEGEGNPEGSVEGEGAVIVPEVCPEGALFSQPPQQPTESWQQFFSDSASGMPMAEQYAITGSAVAEVTWWGFTLPLEAKTAVCQGDLTEFILNFYENDEDLPGVLTASVPITPEQADTGVYYGQKPLYRYTATLEHPVPLTAGWISVVGQSQFGCVFLWLSSAVGDSRSAQSVGSGWTAWPIDLSLCLSPGDIVEGEEGEGAPEGQLEGFPEGEGAPEGQLEGFPEGEGSPEGQLEGYLEGEGTLEAEHEGEGALEGQFEGFPEGEGGLPMHSADQNGDGIISLTELLRVIQFFNAGGYHCPAPEQLTEDGYLPEPGENYSCTPHSSDYNPPDWRITLGELLRLIQFFNSGGYHLCPESNTEDDYCPGSV